MDEETQRNRITQHRRFFLFHKEAEASAPAYDTKPDHKTLSKQVPILLPHRNVQLSHSETVGLCS